MGKVLTFDDIAQASDLGEQEVDMPEWGGSVVIRPLTVAELDKARVEGKDATSINKLTLRMSLVKPALTPDQIETIWATRSGTAMSRLLEAIARANGMGDRGTPEEAQKEKEAAFR